MLVEFLLGMVTDLVLGSAKTMRRSFHSEMERYFEERGLDSAPPARTPTR
jgi:hypothetical protein